MLLKMQSVQEKHQKLQWQEKCKLVFCCFQMRWNNSVVVCALVSGELCRVININVTCKEKSTTSRLSGGIESSSASSAAGSRVTDQRASSKHVLLHMMERLVWTVSLTNMSPCFWAVVGVSPLGADQLNIDPEFSPAHSSVSEDKQH